jgi:hypothetical protein
MKQNVVSESFTPAMPTGPSRRRILGLIARLFPLGIILGGCGGSGSKPPGEKLFLDECTVGKDVCECVLDKLKKEGRSDSAISDYAKLISQQGGIPGELTAEGCF